MLQDHSPHWVQTVRDLQVFTRLVLIVPLHDCCADKVNVSAKLAMANHRLLHIGTLRRELM